MQYKNYTQRENCPSSRHCRSQYSNLAKKNRRCMYICSDYVQLTSRIIFFYFNLNNHYQKCNASKKATKNETVIKRKTSSKRKKLNLIVACSCQLIFISFLFYKEKDYSFSKMHQKYERSELVNTLLKRERNNRFFSLSYRKFIDKM